MFLQVFTSVIVLGLAITAFVIIEVKGFKNRKVKSSNTIAQVIGSNSISALEFMDRDAAKKILSDLTFERDILNAALLDKNGSVFASYTKEEADTAFRFSIPGKYAPPFLFTDNYLFVYHKIQKDNETLGVVCIRFELSQLNTIKMNIYLLGLVLLLIGIGFAFLIAVILQPYISNPLLNLVTVMQKVRDTADYKIRAIVEGKDEIGILSLSFNTMLSTIERKGNELAQSRQQLDQKNTLLNSVLQNMGDGLVVADKTGKFILWNVTGEKMLGMEPLDISQEKWTETYGFFLPDAQTPFSTSDLPLVKAL
ncbi:MAG: HAMP domain-containing protein, partial [Bacteroidetes bacterium]|nr:HAMP domain-containing protein [Bacteroidota bacterium]